jgi:endonuclease YncB( thermonuclease family)
MRCKGWFATLALSLAVAASPAMAGGAQVLHSYAIVNNDASLIVRGKRVYLFGIYVPEADQLCGRVVRPVFCGTRAAVALDLKITGFVRCEVVEAYDDGSVGAFCAVGTNPFSGGEDLGAYLISRGLALAGPGAPFEYAALERIAAANGRGVWGFQVDAMRRPRIVN